jgi:hypothetical protein
VAPSLRAGTTLMSMSPRAFSPVLIVCVILAAASPTRGDAQSRSADARDRSVRVHNQTGWDILRLEATPPGAKAWRPQPLRRPVLPNGDSVAITIDDGSGACLYDLRAEFTNGQSRHRARVDVCAISDFYFTL